MDKTLDDSDMILHLQLKIKGGNLKQQLRSCLDRKYIFCLLNPDDLGLLFEQKENQKIAVSSLLCPGCWEQVNKDDRCSSKGLIGESVIRLPCNFKEFQSELKEINKKLVREAKAKAKAKAQAEAQAQIEAQIQAQVDAQSKATENKNVEERSKAKAKDQTNEPSNAQILLGAAKSFFRSLFEKSPEQGVVDSSANNAGEVLGAASLELQNQDADDIFNLFFIPEEKEVLRQLEEFCHYKTLKNRFLEAENISNIGYFSPAEYEASTKMVYINVKKNESGYFVFDSVNHAYLYKVIIKENGEGQAFKVYRGNNQIQWNNFLSIAKGQILEREKLKPKPEKPEYFNLPDLLSILVALDEEVENEN